MGATPGLCFFCTKKKPNVLKLTHRNRISDGLTLDRPYDPIAQHSENAKRPSETLKMKLIMLAEGQTRVLTIFWTIWHKVLATFLGPGVAPIFLIL